jgi:hypothetical protein
MPTLLRAHVLLALTCLAGCTGDPLLAAEESLAALGTPCHDNSDCGAQAYCNITAPAPQCGATGVCAALAGGLLCGVLGTAPKVPACGCDGRTYPSACLAHFAGVAIAKLGACPPTTCTSPGECGGSAYCAHPTGACFAAGDCAPVPRLCPRLVAPVCGCDGRTYVNECNAAGHGVSVAHTGAC